MEHGKIQLAGDSSQRASKQSFACAVIRSLRFAVICCNGLKLGFGMWRRMEHGAWSIEHRIKTSNHKPDQIGSSPY